MRWTIDHSAPSRLQDQIAACVRRGIADGDLAVGEQLPPAAELAAALDVDRNTVLAAYRNLRDDGVLEFRRGRGARIARAAPATSAVTEAARAFIAAARQHGLTQDDQIRLIKELT